MDDSELEKVKSAIVEKCRNFWKERRKAYLLSKAGIDLPGVGPYIRNVTGKRLRDFIETDLSDALRLERWSRYKNISGMFPKDAVLTDEIDSYFEFLTPEPREGQPVPRYNPSFWAAFVKPLQPGQRRFISIAFPIKFEDLSEDTEDAERLEIDRALIVSPTESDRDRIVLENIQTWLKRHKLDGSSFLMRSRPEFAHLSWDRTRMGAESPYGHSELEYLIEAVGNRDLARIHLPLDIVARLLGKRRSK
jgi:hypothetical protein